MEEDISDENSETDYEYDEDEEEVEKPKKMVKTLVRMVPPGDIRYFFTCGKK